MSAIYGSFAGLRRSASADPAANARRIFITLTPMVLRVTPDEAEVLLAGIAMTIRTITVSARRGLALLAALKLNSAFKH